MMYRLAAATAPKTAIQLPPSPSSTKAIGRMQHVAVSKATTEPTRPALETMADIPRAPSTPKVVIWRPSLGYASCSGYRIKGLDGCTRSARRPGKAALLWKPSATTSASVLRSEEHTSE